MRKKKEKRTQSEKKRKNRIFWLKEMCQGMINQDPLTDGELEFLTENFHWNKQLLAEIERTRQRPFSSYPDGFYKRCKKCRAFRNYCCC